MSWILTNAVEETCSWASMTIGHIISAQKNLLKLCEEGQSYTILKDEIISVNQLYLDYVNSGGHATPFERRQVKNNMNRLFQAVDKADLEANGTRLCFVGPPIPPTETRNQISKPQIMEKYEPLKICEKKEEELVLGPNNAKLHVYLENIERSTIVSSKKPDELPWSLHAQSIKNCQVALSCDGPIILHDIENLVLILRCHQLRIHNMKNCRVYASVANDKIIIEDSNGLVLLGFSDGSLSSPRFLVDDFDWPSSETASPHYSMVNMAGDNERDDAEDAAANRLLKKWDALILE